jgi:hypothetical protein
MFSPYYQLAKQLFPNAKIVLDRFHIVQHLSRAMNWKVNEKLDTELRELVLLRSLKIKRVLSELQIS